MWGRPPKSENRCAEVVEDGATLRLCGGIGSPYTNKLLALLRYRRLPYRYLLMDSPEETGTADPPVAKVAQRLMPKLLWPDGRASNDSTPLIRELEAACRPGERSVRPTHAGLAFLCDLLEDVADEWLTKSMYHYRWTHDAPFAARTIALQQVLGPHGSQEALESVAAFVQSRQVGRREIVGSTPTTRKLIEDGFNTYVALLDAHLAAGHRFLLGSRPSAADFAVFGQLHPMIALDPNTSRGVHDASVRVPAWYNTTADLSGLSLASETEGWLDPEQPLPPTLLALLAEAGRTYAPFMVANAQAVRAGIAEVVLELDDGRWAQPAFRYQSKCLATLRAGFALLGEPGQAWVRAALSGTGCEVLLADDEAGLSRL